MKTKKIIKEVININGFSEIRQDDPEWYYQPFGRAGEYFASSACGLFAICIILGYTALSQIMQVYNYLLSNGWATDRNGTWQCGIYKALCTFGVQAEQITDHSIGCRKGTAEMQRAKQHVINGFTLILLMGSAAAGTTLTNKWTSGGHYITVIAYDPNTGMFYVQDPAGRNTGWHYWEEFEGDVKHVFLVYKSWCNATKGEVEDMRIWKNLPQVQNGSEGMHVLLCQEILKSRGIIAEKKYGGNGEPIELDSKCGPNLTAGIKSFEEIAQITIDGLFGPTCWYTALGGL